MILNLLAELKNNPPPKLSEDEALRTIDEAGLAHLINEDGEITARISVDRNGEFSIFDTDGFKLGIGSKVALAIIALSVTSFASDGKSIDAIDISALAVLAMIATGVYYFKGKRLGTKGLDTAKVIMSQIKDKLTTRVCGGR